MTSTAGDCLWGNRLVMRSLDLMDEQWRKLFLENNDSKENGEPPVTQPAAAMQVEEPAKDEKAEPGETEGKEEKKEKPEEREKDDEQPPGYVINKIVEVCFFDDVRDGVSTAEFSALVDCSGETTWGWVNVKSLNPPALQLAMFVYLNQYGADPVPKAQRDAHHTACLHLQQQERWRNMMCYEKPRMTHLRPAGGVVVQDSDTRDTVDPWWLLQSFVDLLEDERARRELNFASLNEQTEALNRADSDSRFFREFQVGTNPERGRSKRSRSPGRRQDKQKPKKRPRKMSKRDEDEEGSQAEEGEPLEGEGEGDEGDDGFTVVDDADSAKDFRRFLGQIRSSGRSYLVNPEDKDPRHVMKRSPALAGVTKERQTSLGFHVVETEPAPTRKWTRAEDQASSRSKTVKRNSGSRFAPRSFYRGA